MFSSLTIAVTLCMAGGQEPAQTVVPTQEVRARIDVERVQQDTLRSAVRGQRELQRQGVPVAPADPPQGLRLQQRLYSQGLPTSPRPMEPPNYAFVLKAAAMPDLRLNLDFDGVTVKEALKRVFEQAKVEYAVEPGLALDTKFTMKIPNIRFTTALDLVTQSAGVNWSREIRVKKEIKDGHEEIAPSSIFRIGRVKRGSSLTVFNPSADAKFGQMVWHYDTGGMEDMLAGANMARLVNVMVPDERSSFTCPHCHGQVTAYLPKASARPGRRVPAAPVWRFCPLCGKNINVAGPDGIDATENEEGTTKQGHKIKPRSPNRKDND
jgi:hypothetical protein